jgi:hypothetical protein
MKYLKSFNESIVSLKNKKIVEEIKDILLPISDMGYDINVNYERDLGAHRYIIRVVTYLDKALIWSSSVEEEFDRLVDFLSEYELEIYKVYYVAEEKDGRILNRSNRTTVNYDTFLENMEKHSTKKLINLLFEVMNFNSLSFKHLKTSSDYKESITFDLNYQKFDDILESLNIWHDALLSSIDAEEIDMFDTLHLPKKDYINKLDIEYLSNNIEFINSLSSIGLKKSEIKNSEDFQTFLNKPCKYMFIYDVDSNELENPEYLLFQVWNENLGKWEDSKLYKVNEDVKRFYEKLTSRTIEIVDGDESYIYETSNGSEWILQSVNSENDIYKKVFRRKEIQDLLNSRSLKVNVI